MKKRLMLAMLIVIISAISSCTTTTKPRVRFLTGDPVTEAVIDSLQARLLECEIVMDECCSIVGEDLIRDGK